MDIQVKNIYELKLEISRLKGAKELQSLAIRQRFSSFSTTFSTISSLFPKSQIAGGANTGGVFNQDIVQLISSFALPFVLNKTLFRRSNATTKSLVRFISIRASRFINQNSLGHLWDKVKTLVSAKTKKDKSLNRYAEYGD